MSSNVQFLFNGQQLGDKFPQIWSQSIINNPKLLIINHYALFGPTKKNQQKKIGHTMHSHHKLFTDAYQGRSMTLP